MTISDKVILTGEIDAPKPDIWMVEGHSSSALSIVLDLARDYATATLASRLTAIRVVHQGNQQTSAHDAPAVREVMRGIRNRQKDRSSPKKAPLIDTDLTLITCRCSPDTFCDAALSRLPPGIERMSLR